MLEVIPRVSREGTIRYPDGTTGKSYEVPLTEDFRFEVLEVFKGNPDHEVMVTGGNGQFRQGQEYLIFVSLNSAPEKLETSVCSADHLVENADLDPDISWLRAYPNSKPTATISGKVSWGYGQTASNDRAENFPSVGINLEGEKNLTALISSDHSYEFKDLPPGTYALTALVPDGYAIISPQDTRTVTIAAKGCAEIDWAIARDTHISGAVTDATGQAISGARIGLLRPAANRTGFDVVTSQGTDANGHYDFSKIPPGDYWVALHYLGPNNLDPYVPVYYPSGDRSSSANLIHLGPSGRLENVDLVLTPALRQITLHVHVVNPDGSPVMKAHVIANDPLTPTQAMAAVADDSGDADINLYEGREYHLIASTSGLREPACAGPVKFVAKEGLQLDTLTLDKSWNECRALQRAH